MKKILCLIALFFLLGCGSSAVMKDIRKNAKLYENLGNTKRVLTKDAIIYIQYTPNKNRDIFIIDINSKERNSDIVLTECKVNGKTASIAQSASKTAANIGWMESYTVSGVFNKKKKGTIECSLSSQEKFKESF